MLVISVDMICTGSVRTGHDGEGKAQLPFVEGIIHDRWRNGYSNTGIDGELNDGIQSTRYCTIIDYEHDMIVLPRCRVAGKVEEVIRRGLSLGWFCHFSVSLPTLI